MQDVFKVVYSEEVNDAEAVQAEKGKGKGKGKTKASDAVSPPQEPERSRSLRDILSFINAQFAEFDPSSSYRQPHFNVCRRSCRPLLGGNNADSLCQMSYGNRTENSRFRMFSLVVR
jgi:hypothetical protein